MSDFSQIPDLKLKVLFIVHFVFTSLSCMGNWNATAFLFYNSVFIIFLVWSLYDHQRSEPVLLALVVNCVSIMLDILLLIIGFPGQGDARNKFSAAMAILHLIIRPFSAVLLYRNFTDRFSSDDLSGILRGHRETYEDIDGNSQPQTSSHMAGSVFSSAQQI